MHGRLLYISPPSRSTLVGAKIRERTADGAAHAATIQAENAEWWQAVGHWQWGASIWSGIVAVMLG